MLRCILVLIALLTLYACKQPAHAQWSQPELVLRDAAATDSSLTLHHPRLVVSDSGIFVFYNHAITNSLIDPTDVFVMKKLPTGWSTSQNVTNTPTPSFAHTVAADNQGRLHIVWQEQQPWGNRRRAPLRYATDILYSCGQNGAWSAPERLFGLDSNGYEFDRIQGHMHLLADEDNVLNLVLCADVLLGRSLPAPRDSELVFIRRENDRWSNPRKAKNYGGTFSLAVGRDGKIYCSSISVVPRVENNSSVFCAVSDDKGKTWSQPRLVSFSYHFPAYHPIIFATGSGPNARLFAVWLKDYDPDSGIIFGFSFPDGVWAAFSDDEGRTWSKPETLSVGKRYVWGLRGVVDRNDNLHIIYVSSPEFGGIRGSKLFYHILPKGGKWSAPMELVSTGVLANFNADIAVGRDGKVHIVWVDAERAPRGIYYMVGNAPLSSTREPEGSKPQSFALFQNYPNPFNPSTTIRYALPTAAMVSLKVYDVLGREVATLVSERQAAGEYAVPFNATGLASGVYFYRLQAGSYVETKKMMLAK